jgi:chromate reductase, NAD(P)H dehydrogenase (quinone)
VGRRTERANVTILGIPGSLRTGSFNRGLLRAADALAPNGVEVVEFVLHEIPPFDADLEREGDPRPVVAFKHAIRDADALLIATPEYNRGTSGVLKNAIDWASRPAMASPLAGKVVGLMGASAGMRGTAAAQQQVRDALAFSRAHALEEPAVLVPTAYEKFETDGTLTDTATLAQVAELVNAVVGACAQVRAA